MEDSRTISIYHQGATETHTQIEVCDLDSDDDICLTIWHDGKVVKDIFGCASDMRRLAVAILQATQ